MKSNCIPDKMLAWPLFGEGMENFGKDDRPCVIPLPEIKDDELLVRIDAIGLCFSDVKLIRAGKDHPRVISKDLASDPIIPGHEAVMTVVKVGNKLKNQYEEGMRFIIQADIYVKGKGFAYGYAINGGMEQYSVIDQRVLNGDEGCYLLPISDKMPSAVAALLEPWTCVQASYMIENRTAPLLNGTVLIAGDNSDKLLQAGELLRKAFSSKVSVWNISESCKAALEQELKIKISVLTELPSDQRFDDIFICNVRNREEAEALAKLGTRGAVISFVGDYPNEPWSFDVGRIHYENWFYQGTRGNVLSDAYNRNVRSSWKKGGVCWLPGGAGAMGQMHTQMAVESPDGPQRIIVSDMDNDRIANLKHLLKDAIAARNIEFETINPKDCSSEEFENKLKSFAPEGFDDIIMLVPVVPVLNQAAKFLGKNGLMNIFAGIPAGKEGELNIGQIVNNNVRFIGSSGSKTAHLRHTLQISESGKLKPVTALAAIGGMNALKEGLNAVIEAKYPGKTVIFPNCPTLPLTSVHELAKLGDEIADTLDNDGFYSQKTEQKLLEKFGL